MSPLSRSYSTSRSSQLSPLAADPSSSAGKVGNHGNVTKYGNMGIELTNWQKARKNWQKESGLVTQEFLIVFFFVDFENLGTAQYLTAEVRAEGRWVW